MHTYANRWVDTTCPRIQPDFKVGDKMTVKDTVNKESEAEVMDVTIRENCLQILIHYVGWSTKWYTHTRTHIHMHTYKDTHTHTQDIHTHIHTYTGTHTHIHTQG
jgi:hypothetical protein